MADSTSTRHGAPAPTGSIRPPDGTPAARPRAGGVLDLGDGVRIECDVQPGTTARPALYIDGELIVSATARGWRHALTEPGAWETWDALADAVRRAETGGGR